MRKAPQVPSRGIVESAMNDQRIANAEAVERARIREIGSMSEEELKEHGAKNEPRVQAKSPDNRDGDLGSRLSPCDNDPADDHG